ncbi:hypothetical protein DAPPUDRAFT_219945 [Daphnia pulex]|uniref:Uncharacterized protein n=1 Tax=Daphnia pulex TaxID=6669 RepID=E9FRQ7_DAPPU|nr:hypothetical protein DAPPUDRAFT_219945 [Daphnia pulex]|eukprot:EFX89892.1 hypothetical protein DAPPUDRAFT_219945 [Daphnia pulex]
MEVDQIWNIFESQGLKLPDYLIKLLLCSGYDVLQSLCKLTSHQLIEELENYATDCLDASDLGFSESEAKYYFSNRTMKFNILPGHKHLLVTAAEMATKLIQHSDNEDECEFEKLPIENDHSTMVEEKPSQHNGLHFLSEFSSLGSRNKTPKSTTPSNSHSEPIASVEEEQNSLIEFLKTWITRKILSGLLAPFLFDVDYRVQVYRPKSSNQSSRTDIYSFVCLRCNTTIRAFKRPNGQNWNAANVCRHITTVHFLATSKSPKKLNYHVSSLSTPPLSDSSPNEQDPLN